MPLSRKFIRMQNKLKPWKPNSSFFLLLCILYYAVLKVKLKVAIRIFYNYDLHSNKFMQANCWKKSNKK